MFNRLKNLFDSVEVTPKTDDTLSLAAAALLTHAARLDGQTDGIEIDTLRQILQDGFSLSKDETQELMMLADTLESEANDLYQWTKVINAHYELPQKVVLIEKLWMVVLSDGRLDDFEANLLRRISGLIHVPDIETGAARQRAAINLGLKQPD
ncbi:MAG: hypothetical protein CML73_04400 [Rhodobiaceae bacterium]|nr:hypothetical protein [Rhodobiaceae bacterium]